MIPTLRQIAKICAMEFGVTVEKMKAPMSTEKHIDNPALLARWSFYFVGVHLGAHPRLLRSIGGGVSAKYVLESIEQIEGMVECDPELAARIERIEQEIDRLQNMQERAAA